MTKVIISVTSDLISDSRVHKVATTLTNKGWDVTLVGRKLKNSLDIAPRAYKTKRFSLFFEKGFLFYKEYSLRLFFYLLFHKSDILVSNDLDTLLPNFIVSKIKKNRLFYDTHEYFTGVPELLNRDMVRGTWERIEKMIFPKLKHVYTVNASIAKLYEEKYKVQIGVVRNVPLLTQRKNDLQENNSQDQDVILYQGAVNKDRGLEEMIEAMVYVNKGRLLIIGDGDVLEMLKKKAEQLHIKNKVTFINKLPFEALRKYTETASIGLCIEKDTNINYRYCLPNKLFDYIHAGVPVLASPLLEIKQVVDKYNIGTFIDTHEPEHIANTVNKMLEEKQQLAIWKKNTEMAALEMNWQNEEQMLLKIFEL